jgi:WD40 repeat protein
MRSTGWRQQRLFTASLCASLGLLLSACGGGSDQTASEPSRTALASDRAASSSQALQLVHKRKALSHDRKGVTAIVVTREGNAVGVANSDGRVRVLDPSSTREIRILKVEGGMAAAGLIFSADGRHLVTVSRDSVAQVWSVETGERRFTLRGHEHALRSVAASPDGSVIATGGEETRVMLWDGTTGRLKRILTGHTDFVNSLSMSPDGRLLASGDADARILVWDITTGRLLHTLRGHSNEVNAVAFSVDGQLLASAGEDGKVLLWDMSAGRRVQALDGQRAPVRSLAFNSDGGLLAAGALDGKVVVWDMTTRTVLQDFAGSSTAVNAMAFDGQNKNQLFVGSEENRVRSLNVSRSAVQ